MKKAVLTFALAFLGISVFARPQIAAQNLATLHVDAENAYRSRDLVRAAELSKELLAAATQAGDRKEIAFAQLIGARVAIADGEFQRALDALESAIQTYRELDDQSGIATATNEKALAYRNTGRLPEALDLHQQARLLFEQVNNKEGLAQTYYEIGGDYLASDNYRNALEALQRGLQFAEEADLPRAIANITNSIGNVYNQQGNRELALEFYQRSLQIKERVGNSLEIINTLVNMANVSTSLRRFDEARARLDRALELAKPGDPRARAQVLNRYGRLLFAEGKFDQALVRLNEALPLLSSGRDELIKGDTLIRIARAQAETGRLEESMAAAAQAAELAERQQSPMLQLLALEVRGVVARELGKYEDALSDLQQMIAIEEKLRESVAGDATQVQAYLRTEGDEMHGVVELLMALNRPVEAFQMAERNKGRALLTVLGEDNIRLNTHLTPDERNREATLTQAVADANIQLEQAQQRPGLTDSRRRELETQVERARLDLAAFETTLYAVHPELQIHRNEIVPVAVDQAAAILPDSRTLLLEYDLGPTHSYLFTLSRDDSGKPVFNVHEIAMKRAELIKRVTTFRTKIGERDLGFRDEARKLYDVLLGPAAAELVGKDTLLIVPDSALWQLPFQALENSANLAVIEKQAVFFAPSMTVLSRMKNPTATPGAQETLFAVGDADIARELPELRNLYGSQRSRVVTGAQATESIVKEAASQYRIVHVATHGFYDDKHPMNSYLQLSRAGDRESDDGKLEAREMMTLDLNADLVILSACETARGDASGGEGLIGMTWALLVAGVPTAVASQWKVDSASTTDLMLRFHRSLTDQLNATGALTSKAKTLQQAALGIMKNPQYRHPFYWAGFIMVGQGF